MGNQSLDTNNLSFSNMIQHRSINQTFGGGGGDMSMNMSGGGVGDEVSFGMRAASRQAFDFTLSNLASPDQQVFGLLKDAFQFYLKKEERQSQTLVDEIVKTIAAEQPRKLDVICVELSERLIDDVPAHDPRWAEQLSSNKSSKSLNTNLIISNQLKGKIRLHEYFLTFLRKMSLWDKVSYSNLSLPLSFPRPFIISLVCLISSSYPHWSTMVARYEPYWPFKSMARSFN